MNIYNNDENADGKHWFTARIVALLLNRFPEGNDQAVAIAEKLGLIDSAGFRTDEWWRLHNVTSDILDRWECVKCRRKPFHGQWYMTISDVHPLVELCIHWIGRDGVERTRILRTRICSICRGAGGTRRREESSRTQRFYEAGWVRAAVEDRFVSRSYIGDRYRVWIRSYLLRVPHGRRICDKKQTPIIVTIIGSRRKQNFHVDLAACQWCGAPIERDRFIVEEHAASSREKLDPHHTPLAWSFCSESCLERSRETCIVCGRKQIDLFRGCCSMGCRKKAQRTVFVSDPSAAKKLVKEGVRNGVQGEDVRH